MRKLRPILRWCLFLGSAALIAGASAFTGQQPPAKMSYQLVAGWPAWPKDIRPDGISAGATDSKGNVYLLHRIKPYVMVFAPDGKFSRSWDGDFTTPHGLRIDKDDNVWIADMDNHLVQKFDLEGKLLLSLGTKNKPGLGAEQFNRPADVNTGPDGEIYIADGYGNSRVAKFSKDGKFLRDWGKKGKGPAQFRIPHAVFLDSDQRVLIGDRENARIQVFDRDGKLLDTWTDTGYPYGLFLHRDRVYLADGRSGRIRIFDKEHKLLTSWETAVGEETPHWINVDQQDAVYIGFVSGNKVQKWAPK
jgi:sugar lactone lactonase YvrE